jgi:hypothetical protein
MKNSSFLLTDTDKIDKHFMIVLKMFMMIKIQLFVFVLLQCVVISSTTGYKDSDSTKKVFAHVMVGYIDSLD